MNQSDRQAAFRAVSGTTGTYNEDFMAYAATLGHTGSFNELMIQFIQGKLTSTNPNMPGLQAAAAANRDKALWTDLGSDVTSLGAV